MSAAAGEDILGRLDAAITQREQSVRDADKEIGRTWSAAWDSKSDAFNLVSETELMVATGLLPGCSRHATLHDPESVLRRCAADRRMLARHVPHHSEAAGAMICQHDSHRWPCPDITDLAEGYGLTGGDR